MSLSAMYQAQIQQNYNVAIGYYKQRHEFMQQLYEMKTGQAIENLTSYINERVEYYWTNVVQEVLKYVNDQGGRKEIKGKELPDLEFSLEAQSVLKQLATAGGLPTTILGNEFENFLYESLSLKDLGDAANAVVAEASDTIVDNLLNSSLSASHTGSITAKSAVVTGKRAIRPDIGLGFSEKNLQGMGVELQGLLDLSEFTNALYEEMKSQKNESLLDFLRQPAFGLSLKIWKNANNAEFSSSSPLQNMLNNQLYTYHALGYRTTWEGQYTIDYVNYQLSKYLINIISPLNVAMVTGAGFIWMDQFLENKMFFMHLQLNGIKKSSRGPQLEGFPEITDPGIYIRAAAQGINVFNYTIGHSKKTGKIWMKKRSINTNA